MIKQFEEIKKPKEIQHIIDLCNKLWFLDEILMLRYKNMVKCNGLGGDVKIIDIISYCKIKL